jgi:hypothetical protein
MRVLGSSFPRTEGLSGSPILHQLARTLVDRLRCPLSVAAWSNLSDDSGARHVTRQESCSDSGFFLTNNFQLINDDMMNPR